MKFLLRLLIAATGLTLAAAADGQPVESKLKRLPAGAVKPTGWLLDRARAAKDGYTGNMDGVSFHFRRAWAEDWQPRGHDLNWINMDNGTWCTEGGGYWFDGLVKLAWQLDDEKLKALAKKRLEPLLSNIHENTVGFLWWMDRRKPEDLKEFLDEGAWQALWVSGYQMRAIGSYWEVTGDERAKNALIWALSNKTVAAFDSSIKMLQNMMATTNRNINGYHDYSATLTSGLVEAWRLTGDKGLYECAKLSAKNLARRSQFTKTPEWWMPETLWTRRHSQWGMGIASRHGVFTCEQLLSLWKAWELTGDEKLRDAVLAWYTFFDTHCRQPYGVTMMDEEWGWAGAKRGTETCDVAAESFVRINILEGTGMGKWGDDLERAQFNAAPACVSRDFKRHCYFQMPNRNGLPGDAKNLSCPYDSQCEYRESKQWPLCCVAALNKILPNYLQAMWMKTAEGGVAATAYGPCTFTASLKDGRIALTEKTNYPFEENIEISIDEAPGSAFPLLLRIPAWCSRPGVTVNGKALPFSFKNGFAKLERPWKKGDRIELTFPMEMRVEVMRDMNDGGRERASIFLGPLLMAYAYPCKDDNTIIGNAKDPVIDLWSVGGAEIVRKAMPKVWDWPLDAPVKAIIKDASGKPLELVPYGCTKLRVSMFRIN